MEQTCADMFRGKELCQDSTAHTIFQLPLGHTIPLSMNYYEHNQTYLPWQNTISLDGQASRSNIRANQNALHYQLSHCIPRSADYYQADTTYFPQNDAYSLEEHVSSSYIASTSHDVFHPAMQYQLNHPIPALLDYHETDPAYLSEHIFLPLNGQTLFDHGFQDVLSSAVEYQQSHPMPLPMNYQVNSNDLSPQSSFLEETQQSSVLSNQNVALPTMQCQLINTVPKLANINQATTTWPQQSLCSAEEQVVPSDTQTGLSHAMENQFTQSHFHSTRIPQPQGTDPVAIFKERENRIAMCINEKIETLRNLLPNLPMSVKNTAMIEIKSLQLLCLQKQLRNEVCGYMRSSTALETAGYPFICRRQKVQGLREARITEELERQQRLQREHKLRQERKEYINLILKHRKVFKEYHLSTSEKIYKLNKAIMMHYSTLEREQKKEQEKIGKERMKRLMAEDEDGYRKLIDQKKDKRLAFLLSQTDEYIKKLAIMVRHHKISQEEEMTRMHIEKQNVIAQTPRSFNVLGSVMCNSQRNPVATTKPGPFLHYDDAMDIHLGTNVADRFTYVTDHKVAFQHEQDKIDSSKQSNFHPRTSVITQDEKKPRKDVTKQKDNVESDEYNDYYNIAHALKEDVKEQASIMVHGKLKEYQVKGLEWLVSLYNNNLNGILADEMGLGKTIQVIALITYLIEKKNVHGPHLIIVPLTTLSNWLLEFERWAPTVSKCEYKGSPNVRRQLATQLRTSKFNVVLTTYEYIMKDKGKLSKLSWKYMIIDEGHRMKNHHCKLTQVLNTYYKTSHRLLLTGTPLQNKLPELWALLNFLLPSIFKSCDTFEQWFNAPFATTGEKVELNDEEQILIIKRLHKVLCPFLLRRLKKEVEAQLPEKVEYVVKCDMSALQHLLYQHMKTKKRLPMDDTDGASTKNHSKSLMNTIMQLRKICNHPFLFPHIEEAVARHCGHQSKNNLGRDLYRASGKFELLDRILPKLQKTGHRVLLFCQMTTLMTIMEDYLCFKNIKYLRLDGTTRAEVRVQLLNLFSDPDSPYFMFLLSTRAGGIGLNLQAADTVIIFDSDWNPHQDLQAQDRAHRIGQQNEVRVLRLITVNSVEERILATAKYKLNIDGKVIQAGMFNQKSTEVQRCEFLQAILSQDENNTEEENEVPDDEAINHMLARNEEEFEVYQKMDGDKEKNVRHDIDKLRLIQESELPEWLVKDVIKVEKLTKARENLPLGRGLRKRKRVDYSDTYADILWHFATESEPSESISEQDYKKNYGGEETNSDTYEMENEKQQKYKKSLAKQSTTQSQLIYEMKCIMDSVAKYKDKKRIISKAFYKLPTKQELPEYYEIIKEPIDIRKIRTRMRKNHYCSLDDLEADFMHMCKNAQTYNHERSLIYKDSVAMQLAFRKARESLKGSEWKEMHDCSNESLDESPTSSFKLKISLGKNGSENRVECIPKMSPPKGQGTDSKENGEHNE